MAEEPAEKEKYYKEKRIYYKMKKSLIVIALAVLMLVPVFATTGTKGAEVLTGTENQKDVVDTTDGNTKVTDVTLQLKLYPKYVFAISSSLYDADNISIIKNESGKTYYEDLPGINEIKMDYDEDKLVVSSPSGTYYISYWFRDYTQSCTLSVDIDQDLLLQDSAVTGTWSKTDKKYTGGSESDSSKFTIKYKVEITPESTGSGYIPKNAVTIYSPGNTESTNAADVASCTATSLLGQVTCGNLKIVLTPTDSETNTTANKYQGNYLSHLTLTLKANS